MPVKVESTPMLPGLSQVGSTTIEARFDAACMSSDGGLLALREIEQRNDRDTPYGLCPGAEAPTRRLTAPI